VRFSDALVSQSSGGRNRRLRAQPHRPHPVPDFIPVIGYLDDLIIVPLAIILVIRPIPAELMARLWSQAKGRMGEG
jgi:hypothetical protein